MSVVVAGGEGPGRGGGGRDGAAEGGEVARAREEGELARGGGDRSTEEARHVVGVGGSRIEPLFGERKKRALGFEREGRKVAARREGN
jgi:hypothetical protein